MNISMARFLKRTNSCLKKKNFTAELNYIVSQLTEFNSNFRKFKCI